MANSIKKNAKKATEAFVSTLIAGVVSGAVTKAAKATGRQLSPEAQQGLILGGTVLLSGAFNGLRNMIKHAGKPRN